MNPFRAIILLGIVGGTAVLLAFGPRADENLPRQRIIVDYWEKWSGNEKAGMQTIVDDFNNTVGAEEGIFVRYVSTSVINQKTLIATAGGVPPDIAGLWDVNLVQYAAMDALRPLDDLAAAHGIDRSYYKKVYWDGCNYNGHLYALVSTPTVIGLFYNKDIFRDGAASLRSAGLDPDRAPTTIDELDRYAEALTIRGKDGHIIRSGFLPMEPNWYVNDYCYYFGGSYFDEANQRFTLTSPPVERAFEWMERYAKRLGKDAMSDFRAGVGNFDSPQNAFLAGQVASEIQGVFLANFIYNRNPAMSSVRWPKAVEMEKSPAERLTNYSWAAAPFPTAVPGVHDIAYCGFDVMAIPRGAPHPNEAFEFIAYVNRQDVIEKLNKLHCKNSPLAKVSDDFLEHHPNPYIAMFEQLAASPHALGPPQIPIMPEVVDEMNALAQQIALLQVEPKTVLPIVQARLQAKLDKFLAQQKQRHPEIALEH